MYRIRYYTVLLLSLLLSVSLQTLPASATPSTSSEDSSDASPLPRPLPHGFRPPLVFKSITGVDYQTWTAPTTNVDPSWPATITLQEIGDGQIQAVSRTKSKLRKGRKHRKASAIKTKATAANNTQDARKFQEPKITRSTRSRPTRANKQKAADVIPTFTTTIPDQSLTSLTTSEVQTINGPQPSDTSGTAHTSLETAGHPSAQPFTTLSLTGSATLTLVDTATLGSVRPTATSSVTTLNVDNIFQPIATDAPPSQISQQGNHPVPRLGIQPQQDRLDTNKFYANLFLGDQTNAVWTHPYSLSWSKGSGQTDSWGFAISHIERSQLATGAATSSDAGDWNYFVNPIGIQSLVISAAELNDGTTLTTDSLQAFSVNANLLAAGASEPTLTFPLIQGMAFVTGEYTNGTPLLRSGIGFSNLTYIGNVTNGGTYKYSVLLADGYTWLIYVTPRSTNYNENSFTLVSAEAIQGPSGFGGYIQIAKVPAGSSDASNIYDDSAGVYATGVSVAGSVEGTAGTYTLSWTKSGATAQPLMIFALPHHVSSFDSATQAGLTDVQLDTTTKGLATAVMGDSWTLVEDDLPIDMSFEPWSPSTGSVDAYSPAARTAMNAAGAAELAQNITRQTNTGSTYFDGKALAKFAAIVYVLHELADNVTLALTGLLKLEAAFASHVGNQMTLPLVYDTSWGGVISNSTSAQDYGNSYYNDHHFHYGYFLYAAAVIGYLDPPWLDEGTNKDWVNMLARDFANPVSDDLYPFSRSFDWYHGHSWAQGLFASADGKDEESSSEDTMASYGIKMWGKIINDKNMEAGGNLMLAIQARTLPLYFLYQSSNTVEPAEYIGNKVSGILFENKIQHITYFGGLPEYIEGIHMLPLMPHSPFIRSKTFVAEEWAAYDFGTYVNTAVGGWRGILMANLAIIDPVTSYDFFSNASGDFTIDMLDSGASQTWYLAFSAALGGSP